jgi:hypothetical protein
MLPIQISNFDSGPLVDIVKEKSQPMAPSAGGGECRRTPEHRQEHVMKNLQEDLNRVLEEHRHESGLHVIGGERRLLDRLVQFFEETWKREEKGAPGPPLEH